MDIDGDGEQDVITGGWSGTLHWFKGLGKRTFAKGETLLAPPPDPSIGGYSLLQAASVAATDWDADGDIDLVVGQVLGKVYLVRNEGDAKAPKFAPLEALSAGGKPIEGHKAGVVVADWDGDGKNDLVVGSEDSTVVWYRNTGTAQAPELAASEELLPAGGGFKQGFRYKVGVADWNADGLADLLVGNFQSGEEGEGYHGYVWLCLRKK